VTYLEKAKELKPKSTLFNILMMCPYDLKLEVEAEDCDREYDCESCWNREMPEVKDS
jgi:hypothetical protein